MTRKKSHEIGFLIKCLHLIAFSIVGQSAEGKLTVQECTDLGFGSQLMCGSCSLLPQFNLTSLEEDCKKCCQSEADDDASTKFPHATLEICG